MRSTEKQKCNYFNHLLYIAALFLLFIHVSFIKFNPLSLSWYFLQNSRKVLFQAATSQSGKQLHVPRLYIILLGFSNSQLIGSRVSETQTWRARISNKLISLLFSFICVYMFVWANTNSWRYVGHYRIYANASWKCGCWHTCIKRW